MRRRLLAGAFQAGLRALFPNDAGNVAMIFALAMPAVLVVSLGAIELHQVASDRKQTQDVADASALAGAEQLGVAPVGAPQRAQSFAEGQLGPVRSHAAVSVSAQANSDGTFSVAIDTQRNSFFGDLLPPGGFHTHVQATARPANSTPLCVVALNGSGLASAAPGAATLVHLTQASTLSASACLVHSNLGITVDSGGGSIAAQTTEAGTVAAGTISPAAILLAPVVSDPFANLNVDPPSSCSTANPPNVTGAQTLQPGLHGAVSGNGNDVITLAPGEHYFCLPINMNGNATLSGTDVVLVFDKNATLNLGGSSQASISGRQSGPLAGFAIIADRQYANTFTLQSDSITSLTGTVYVPTATLDVSGTSRSGTANSPWTVIAAQALQVDKAQLVINANYAASSVPVPTGVGNKAGAGPVSLTN